MFKKDDLVQIKERQIFYDKTFETGTLCYVNTSNEYVTYVQPVDPPLDEIDFEWAVATNSLVLVESIGEMKQKLKQELMILMGDFFRIEHIIKDKDCFTILETLKAYGFTYEIVHDNYMIDIRNDTGAVYTIVFLNSEWVMLDDIEFLDSNGCIYNKTIDMYEKMLRDLILRRKGEDENV
ncbi:MAG: hypothetical protein J6J36_06720 [Clostridia bacterium]|nr:hypothetical protein [Clostridia bacterium]